MSKHSHNHGDGAPRNVEGAGEKVDVKTAQGNGADSRLAPQENQGGGGEKVPESPAAGTPEAKIAALEAELANCAAKSVESGAKIAELNDQYLRKAADFENFRKRVNREKQELTDFANQNLLLDLLPVIDDFERAIKSAETSDIKSAKDFASFYEGIVMIEKGLSNQLESKWGLKRFESAGQVFDPNRHEAIQMEKAAGITEAVVKEDYVKGYFLKDRVIRCAKVKVLMPEAAADFGQQRGTGQGSTMESGAQAAGQSTGGGEPASPGLDREK